MRPGALVGFAAALAGMLILGQAWAGFHVGLPSAVKAQVKEMDRRVRAAASPTPQVHEGSLLVQGNDVLEISDCTYIQRGSILIRDQGVLRIRNCTFIHQAERTFQYDLNCQGNGRLEVSDSRLDANGQFLWWRFLENGRADLQRVEFQNGPIRLWALGNASAALTDCSQAGIYQTESSTVTVQGGSGNTLFPKRTPAETIAVVAADWDPNIVYLKYPVNTPCPQDAIEISADGSRLYFMFTTGLLDDLGARMLEMPNGTYVAQKAGSPDAFDQIVYFNLRQGATADLAFDAACSFTADGSKVYFHSNRPDNLGYQNIPPNSGDFLDIYVSTLTNGVPGPGVNLGPGVNSIYPDGEHGITPDGTLLCFASSRPGAYGGSGDTDLYFSTFNGTSWTAPVNAGNTLNSAKTDMQPCFSADGKTMYYVTERSFIRGIYRSTESGGVWTTPELVIQGAGVGEPALTADGQYLYFVRVYIDDASQVYDADVCYIRKK